MTIVAGSVADPADILKTLAATGFIPNGLHADRSATPVVTQVYIETDTGKFCYCAVAGAWIELTANTATNPSHATMWHEESLVTHGNAIALSVDTSQIFNSTPAQSVAANADAFSQTFIIAAGTYTFSVLGMTRADAGKIDWSIDSEAAFATGQDWYSNPSVYKVVKTTASVTLSAGLHTLKGTVNGKNGSSSGYLMALTKYWFS